MRFLTFLLAWAVKAAAIVLAIVVLNFCLIRLAPGDVATVLAGESGAADSEFLARTRAEFGLDKPLAAQLLTYVGNVLTLDLGVSYRTRRPVADMVTDTNRPAAAFFHYEFFAECYAEYTETPENPGGNLPDAMAAVVARVIEASQRQRG